jgi:hypothetical protein
MSERPTWGDIGDDQHEIELEPIEEPITAPAPIEPEKVPA